MKRLIIALLAIAASGTACTASAQGPDNVNVFFYNSNKFYSCNSFVSYFNPETGSVLYAEGCVYLREEHDELPEAKRSDLLMSLDFVHDGTLKPTPSRIFEECKFVSRQMNPDRSTSTMVDCRS